jgi:hypothetical protein
LLGRFVAFPGSLLGLLARPAKVAKNPPDVTLVIGNPKSFGDYRRHSPTGPKIGFVTGLSRSGLKDFQQLSFLFRVETGFGARMRLCLQGIQAAFLHGPLPSLHRREGSPYNLHDLADFPAFQQELSG